MYFCDFFLLMLNTIGAIILHVQLSTYITINVKNNNTVHQKGTLFGL